MITALIFIIVCVIIMGYITIRTIEEDKRINNMRENTKKSKKEKKSK